MVHRDMRGIMSCSREGQHALRQGHTHLSAASQCTQLSLEHVGVEVDVGRAAGKQKHCQTQGICPACHPNLYHLHCVCLRSGVSVSPCCAATTATPPVDPCCTVPRRYSHSPSRPLLRRIPLLQPHLCADQAVAYVLEAACCCWAHEASRRGEAPAAHGCVARAIVQPQKCCNPGTCTEDTQTHSCVYQPQFVSAALLRTGFDCPLAWPHCCSVVLLVLSSVVLLVHASTMGQHKHTHHTAYTGRFCQYGLVGFLAIVPDAHWQCGV